MRQVHVMYCHNDLCSFDRTNVTQLSADLFSVEGGAIIASSPFCPNCGDDLSTVPYPVPTCFTKASYPAVRGSGSSKGG